MRGRFGIVTALLLYALIPAVQAQESAPSVTSLGLPLGAMFEVVIVSDMPQPSYSWTMSHEGTFLDSQREVSYRTRLIKSGRYELQGVVRDPASGREYARQFTLTVRPETAAILPLAGSAALLADTWPQRDAAGRIVSDAPLPVIRITPNPDSPFPLSLDPDPNTDTDEDGDPRNDQFARGTSFSQNGTAIHLWFIEPLTERTILLSGPGAVTQEVRIMTRETARADDERRARDARENPQIMRSRLGDGTIGFGADLRDEPYADRALLMHWDFGDGQQSLLDRPIHRYARSGTYDVRLRIIDLETGETAGTFVTIAEIDEGTVPPPEEEPIPGEEEPEPVTPPRGDGSSIVRTIFTVLLVALTSVIAGFGFMFALSRLLRRRGLKAAVDAVEEKLITREQQQASVIDVPAPVMPLPETEEDEPENDNSEPLAENESVIIDDAVPPASAGPVDTSDIPEATVPDWLKQGMAESPAPAESASDQEEEGMEDAEEFSETEEDAADSLPRDETGRIPPEEWAKLTPEERERERKRQKRRRYRQHKRLREKGETGPAGSIEPAEEPADDDVQFIVSADSLNGAEPEAEPPPEGKEKHQE
jgi:hypothetical protein